MSLSEGQPPPLKEKLSSREIVRQELFLQMIAKEILSNFVEEFKDALFDKGIEDTARIEATARAFVQAFAELSEEDKNAVLSIPFELRSKKLAALAQKAIEGIGGEELLLELRDENKGIGSTLGYHMSPANIPEPSKAGMPWVVKGTGEHIWQDGLDNGDEPTGPMAFYSLNYMDRYLKKPAPFLYVVVGKKIPGQGHGRSNAGTWGHAPQLDIVQKIDMVDVERELDLRMKELGFDTKNEKREAA